MPTEFQRIRWLTNVLRRHQRAAGSVLGVGDDAAAWTPPEGHTTVMSVDVQNEGVHFRRPGMSATQVGRRAMAVAASDLAAMAAHPGVALVSMTLPEDLPEAYFKSAFRGMVTEAESCGMEIIGGNLAGGALSISITVIGSAPVNQLVRRSGARVGDAIFVTGRPGRAAIGRDLLLGRPGKATPASRACIGAFCSPKARIAEALRLREAIPIHAMIDISDGLAADLRHLLEASSKRSGSTNLRAVLDAATLEDMLDGSVPRGPTVLEVARDRQLEPMDLVLNGGEDYELLFLVAARARSRVARLCSDWETPVTCIGHVERGPCGVFLQTGDAKKHRWTERGFDHFARGKSGGKSRRKRSNK